MSIGAANRARTLGTSRAGSAPATFADVEVSGSPKAATSRAVPACDVQRTATPLLLPDPVGQVPASGEDQRERPRPERSGQRLRRLRKRERQPLGHRAVAHEEEEGLVPLAPFHVGQGREPVWVRSGAESIHGFGRMRDHSPAPQVGNGSGERRGDVRRGFEGEHGHDHARASASAMRKSSLVVTFTFSAESATTSTGNPARSHNSASSVGGGDALSRRL